MPVFKIWHFIKTVIIGHFEVISLSSLNENNCETLLCALIFNLFTNCTLFSISFIGFVCGLLFSSSLLCERVGFLNAVVRGRVAVAAGRKPEGLHGEGQVILERVEDEEPVVGKLLNAFGVVTSWKNWIIDKIEISIIIVESSPIFKKVLFSASQN